MSGEPAEVWARVRFVTAPEWACALHLLAFTGIGLIPVLIIAAASSRRARGWLPMTRASRRKVRTLTWTSTLSVVAGIALGVFGLAALVLAPDLNGPQADLGTRLFVAGLVTFVAGAAGLWLVRPRYGPQGYVMQRWAREGGYAVELRNVHPMFVLAVHQLQRERSVNAPVPNSKGSK